MPRPRIRLSQAGEHRRIEAHLRHQVVCDGLLGGQLAQQGFRVDGRVALGVRGDPDVPEAVIERGEVAQQLRGGRIGTERAPGIAARDEDAVHAQVGEPAHDVAQVPVVAHRLCGDVRHDPEAAPDDAPGQFQGRVDAVRRRTGDRDVGARLEDLEPVLDARAREDLHVALVHGARQRLAFRR